MTYRFGIPSAARGLCLVVIAAVTVGLMGTAAASAAPAPIKIGGLFTEGASVGFPTTGSKTLKAFFRDYNARGGFKGRKIEVVTGNDGFSVEKAVASTKQMIDEGVVAFVGSEAFGNCLGNFALYAQANVYTIGYAGQQPCFSLKQFGSVVQSTPAQIALTAQYAKQNIGGKVCLIAYSVPGGEAVYQRTDQILAKLGTKFAYRNTGVTPTADPTSALLAAKRAGCRAVVTQLTGSQAVQVVNAKATQKIKNLDLLLNGSHDYKLLKATGKNAEGTYFFSYLYPFSTNDSRTKSYRRFISKHNITGDSYSEPAYASAQLFVEALKNVKGPVTRQSVGAAISKLNVKNSLLPGGRFKFGGTGGNNAPIVGGYMVRVRKGKFVMVPKSELTLPPSVRSLAGK